MVPIFNHHTKRNELVRAFLDSGSNISAISRNCSLKFGLEIEESISIRLATFQNSVKKVNLDKTKINLYKNTENFKGNLTFTPYIMDKILDPVRVFPVSEMQRKYLSDNKLDLADPGILNADFLDIDMLIGQDIIHHFHCSGPEFIPGGSFITKTWENKFILAGPVDPDINVNINLANFEIKIPKYFQIENENFEARTFQILGYPKVSSRHFVSSYSAISTEDELETLQQFRDLELLGISPLDFQISPMIEDFNASTELKEGSYVVKLPIKEPQIKQLSNNFFQAFTRLLSGLRRRRKPKYAEEAAKYQKTFTDEIERGVLEKIDNLGTIQDVCQIIRRDPYFFNKMKLPDGRPVCILPHQAVIKKSNGKLRRVHDAKARPGKGSYSLNDCLNAGPNLIATILHVLMGFRKDKYGLVSDIERAFPTVKIAEEHRDLLRCLWVENGEVVVYRFARLPFGLSCSPFLLQATLRKHLKDYDTPEKVFSQFIAGCYMDDLTVSEKTVEELRAKKEYITNTFGECGMNFRDWNTNHSETRQLFAELEGKDFEDLSEQLILGMKWNTVADTLRINSDRLIEKIKKEIISKRDLWKIIPSLFDPMGLLSPYTLLGKMIVMDACKEVKAWDAKIPRSYIDRLLTWAQDFDAIETVIWPRFSGIEDPVKLELYGCCDASTVAIGACVYLISTDKSGKRHSNLILGKTRNKPPGEHSIARLELISAVLLANLMQHAVEVYEVAEENVHYFSDSIIMLTWLYSGSSSWKPFVANQIKKIWKTTVVSNWHHIEGTLNPADPASRGETLPNLVSSSLWKHGPKCWESAEFINLPFPVKYSLDKHYQHNIDLETDKEISNTMKKNIESGFGLLKNARKPKTASTKIKNKIQPVSSNSVPKSDQLIKLNIASVFNISNCHVDPKLITISNNSLFLPNKMHANKIINTLSNSVSKEKVKVVTPKPKLSYIPEFNSYYNTVLKEVTFFPDKNNLYIKGIHNLIDINRIKNYDYDKLMAKTNIWLSFARYFVNKLWRPKLEAKNKIVPKYLEDKLQILNSNSGAELLWIQSVQKIHFSDIFSYFKNNKAKISRGSKGLIKSHMLFLDKELNIIRCTTRNEQSELSYSRIYPILLPTQTILDNVARPCTFTEMLIINRHERLSHLGVPETLSNIRSEFWPIKGRIFVKKVLNRCVPCKKSAGPSYSKTPEPPLPSFRVTREKPFYGTGVDFIGPFYCKDTPNGRTFKTWYITFVCGSTRAVHIEAVKTRSLEDFVLALSRFFDQHGLPSSFISDHEKSFKKSAECLEQIANSKRVRDFLMARRISWNFYTEKSPNKGGFIERLNSPIKKSFYKTVGCHKITNFEQFRSLATHVSSVLNDRPITYLMSDLENVGIPLTPSMLIRGYNLNEPIGLNLKKMKDSTETKLGESYLLSEQLKDLFWKTWNQVYLSELFERHVRNKKAQKAQIVPKIGEVCLIHDDILPRRRWKLGRVVDLKHDTRNNIIRQATVQTLTPNKKLITKLNRSPEKLVPILSEIKNVNPKVLIPLECGTEVIKHLPKLRHSKNDIRHFKNLGLYPPYKRTVQFSNPAVENIGPEDNFVNKEIDNELPRQW